MDIDTRWIGKKTKQFGTLYSMQYYKEIKTISEKKAA